METIGYSTGALARSDLEAALRLLEGHDTGAVELSALRTHEMGALVRTAETRWLGDFRHVSVHAPSAFTAAEEPAIAGALLPLAERGWRVVLHPDTIHDVGRWRAFGDRLCIENMDRRKPGRTVEELDPVFARLPDASFCLDVAHARQCDTSMLESHRLLDTFGARLAEVHVSELDARGRHVRLTRPGIRAFRQIAYRIPCDVPVIIEAPVGPHEIGDELSASLEALGRLVSLPQHA